MARFLLIGALLLVCFWVYSIVDCALSAPVGQRGVSKTSWLLIVILLPGIGGVLWFVIGRPRRSAFATSLAPDDNPEFLGRITSISDQDERIRRLEEELAALDSEADDPVPPQDPPSQPGDADDSDESSDQRGPRG